ncbi:MAG: YeeE/YedE family protein [Mycoplasmataceae bacterium]|nr:YeeE/YedE family protein [Mycoplasmataceae bacterium]
MIIDGALFSILMQGRFKFKTNNMNLKRFNIYLMGGILMGIGTRIGGGCNIGAFYDPIVTTSISGYFFGIFMLIGAIIAFNSLKVFDPNSLKS